MAVLVTVYLQIIFGPGLDAYNLVWHVLIYMLLIWLMRDSKNMLAVTVTLRRLFQSIFSPRDVHIL